MSTSQVVSYHNGKVTSVSCSDGIVTINGKIINTPNKMNLNSVTNINGRLFIGGYEWIPSECKFKRTITAIWHWLF